MGSAIDRFQARKQRFEHYLREHNIPFISDIQTENLKQSFILTDPSRRELARALLSHDRIFIITTTSPIIIDLLRPWSAQEHCNFSINQEDIAEELARQWGHYLLLDTQPSLPPHHTAPISSARLSTSDHPLVELAELSGYIVVLSITATPPSHCYHLLTPSSHCLTHGPALTPLLASFMTPPTSHDLPTIPCSLHASNIELPSTPNIPGHSDSADTNSDRFR
ncbi:hypothetical protein [Dictyobacter halimunensis]|uniref:hypothetical protein n=1 Tax=Dictyobacter halimunensis TaxID=3026934 RepID=UPI0030C6ED71